MTIAQRTAGDTTIQQLHNQQEAIKNGDTAISCMRAPAAITSTIVINPLLLATFSSAQRLFLDGLRSIYQCLTVAESILTSCV
jgi:hypothetical protein